MSNMMRIEWLEKEIRKQKLQELQDQLKPCPFCGDPAHIVCSTRYPKGRDEEVLGFSVVCQNMDCIIYNADNQYWLNENDAIKAWNQRIAIVF